MGCYLDAIINGFAVNLPKITGKHFCLFEPKSNAKCFAETFPRNYTLKSFSFWICTIHLTGVEPAIKVAEHIQINLRTSYYTGCTF